MDAPRTTTPLALSDASSARIGMLILGAGTLPQDCTGHAQDLCTHDPRTIERRYHALRRLEDRGVLTSHRADLVHGTLEREYGLSWII